MQKITLTFTNDDARYIEYFLRALYGKDKRTSLTQLCNIAVRKEVAKQAKSELEEAEKEL